MPVGDDSVLALLEREPGRPFSIKEVGRELDRQRFQQEPSWAREPLRRLEAEGKVKKNDTGCRVAFKIALLRAIKIALIIYD
jgi:hypothetical protein